MVSGALGLFLADDEGNVFVDEGNFVVFAVSAAVIAWSTVIFADCDLAGAAAPGAAFAGIIKALDLASSTAGRAGDCLPGIFAEFAGTLAFFAGHFSDDFTGYGDSDAAALEHKSTEGFTAGVAAEVQHGQGYFAVIFGSESEGTATR